MRNFEIKETKDELFEVNRKRSILKREVWVIRDAYAQ